MNMKKKKKRSAMSIFVQNFVRSVVLILAIFILGFGSYKLTFLYYDKVGGPKDNKSAKIVKEYFGEMTVEDISKNLILSVEQETGQVKSIVLEIFNKNTSNFDYVTIPTKTQFTISNELYQKLFQAGLEAPQIIRLSKADEYFTEETLYQYMVILLEDYLGIDISYYTVVPQNEFRKMFKKQTKTRTVEAEEEGQEPVTEQYSIYRLRKSYLEEVRKLTDEDSIEDYIKEKYELCESSLPLRGKLEYVESYLNGNIDCAYIHSIYGTEKSGYFEAEQEKTVSMIEDIVGNTTSYTIPQDTGSSTTNSNETVEGLVVEILNASNITGLAASYQKKLVELGYNVPSIGNYTQGSLSQSKIIVKEESMGQRLSAYVPNAQIEVGALHEGIDAQIILGSDAVQ